MPSNPTYDEVLQSIHAEADAFEARDYAEGIELLDAFIRMVNEDHTDTIRLTRSQACIMRDEIIRLRRRVSN